MRKLLIGIIILSLLVPSVVSVSINKTTQSKNGNTLYVGGSGPGNYTKIQDAINDASNGDTVFVYNGMYKENVIVNKSINLIGENRTTTIIDGEKLDNAVRIKTSFVNMMDFTTINCSDGDLFGIYISGILLRGKKDYIPNEPPLTNVTITNCIIKNNTMGIFVFNMKYVDILNCSISNSIFEGIMIYSSTHVNIKNCIINDNGWLHEGGGGGIIIRDYGIGKCENISISYCDIYNNKLDGINLKGANIEIHHNSICRNAYDGISSGHSSGLANKINIYDNNISYNGDTGIHISINNEISGSYQTSIFRNNFINNKKNAFFTKSLLSFIAGYKNNWDKNYWSDYKGRGAYFIRGRLIFLNLLFIPFLEVDWNPASEPYDIPGSSNFVGCGIK